MSNISVIGSKDGPAVDARELGEWIKANPDAALPAHLGVEALTATYVTYVDSVTGLPLVGKHVIITVDQATDDIADIVVEDI